MMKQKVLAVGQKRMQSEEELSNFRVVSKKLALKALAAGWDGSLISHADKEKALKELLKEKKFK